MSDDPGSSEPSKGSPSPSEHPALVAYRQRTRRAMQVYAGALIAVLVLAFVAVRIAYAHGELNKVSATTAPSPSQVPQQATGTTLTQAWHTDDRPAGGNPYADGIVVSYSPHTVNGRDAVTGAVRWHYTRSDETICSVLQQDSSTIAIYDRHGNCDEVTGFVTATGVTKWFRTLMDDGSSTSTDSASNVVLTVAANSVHVFDNGGGLDRWNWPVPAGCTADRALAGSLGVLISLSCPAGHQLVLRDEFKDTTTWTVNTPAAMVPVAAAAFIGAADPATGQIHSYVGKTGKDTPVGRLSTSAADLTGLRRAATSVSGQDRTGQAVEFLVAGRLYALSHLGAVRWSAAASSAPSLAGDSLVAVTAGGGQVAQHRFDGGAVQLSSTLSPAAGAADRPFLVGAGLLLAGAGATMYR